MFIDFTKAFDPIIHNILFRKLASYGITGPPLKLIQSYLLNREQIVSLSDVLSDTKIINIGVPQGPFLGRFYSCYILTIYRTASAGKWNAYCMLMTPQFLRPIQVLKP